MAVKWPKGVSCAKVTASCLLRLGITTRQALPMVGARHLGGSGALPASGVRRERLDRLSPPRHKIAQLMDGLLVVPSEK